MIQIDIRNTLKKQIKSNGIADTELSAMLRKSAKGIKNLEQMRKKHQIGFLDVFREKTTIEEINTYAKKVKGKFNNVVVIGIGGSSLGTQALFSALKPINWNNWSDKDRSKLPRLYFIDHMDSEYISELTESIDLKKTLFIVISKSGGTIEPMSVFFALEKILAKKIGKAWTNNMVAITDPQKSLLKEIADSLKIQTFLVPKNIGGRYSVLTVVGLLPIALVGINIEKLLEGAKEAEKLWLKDKKNPIAELATVQYILDHRKENPITVFMPYSKKLEKVADWYIQLLAESIGKSEEVGPTPIKAIGPTDQHSQMQLFMEGPNNKFILFIEVKESNVTYKIPSSKKMQHLDYLGGKTIHQILSAELKANAEALTEMKRPNATITLEEINEKSIGALLYMLEAQVALLGELYKVNAFNQPGVELSKKLTKKYL